MPARRRAGKRFAATEGHQLAIVFVPSDSVQTDASGKTTAVRAGHVDVRCTFPWLGVGDEVGAQIAITPGPVASVDAALSATSIVAGGGVTATCTAHDAFGNVVPDAKPSFTSTPTDAGNVITGMKGNFTHAGIYDLADEIAGAQAHAVPIEVLPGPGRARAGSRSALLRRRDGRTAQCAASGHAARHGGRRGARRRRDGHPVEAPEPAHRQQRRRSDRGLRHELA